MTVNDLGTSLHRRKLRFRISREQISPLRLATGVTVAAGLVLGLWLTVGHDPLGGEPNVVVRLEPEKTPAPPTDGAGGQTIGIREGLSPEGRGTKVAARRADEPAQPDDADADDAVYAGPSALPRAPIKGFFERGKQGLLPKIASDGRTPSSVYARPAAGGASGANGARIAILIGGMGLSPAGTSDAINKLPDEITLAFAPYARNLGRWAARARAQGHEIMLQVPMEPYDYPDNDPGPYTLLTTLETARNIERLEWLMSRFTGYTGVVNYMGAKFTASSGPLRAILAALHRRGLLFVDDGTSPRSRAASAAAAIGMRAATANLVIDAVQSETAIEDALAKLEKTALAKGMAIGVGSGLPVTIELLSEWARTLDDKGITLVPVSALVARKKG